MVASEHDEPVSHPQAPARAGVSDRSLLRRLQTGQADASTELYVRYAERLLALAAAQSSSDLARRVDPEDIVQSVFRTFFRRATLGHYTVPDGEEIWKLLLVIALNKVRATGAFHRAAKRDVRRTADGEAFDRAIDSEPGQDEAAMNFLRLTVEELLEGMPAAHRRMIELRIEGHEVNDIAAAVKRSKRSVERVLHDFRKHLDTLIGEDR
jgi:RNA polymerase sigma-70 factor (ECF subfamily)